MRATAIIVFPEPVSILCIVRVPDEVKGAPPQTYRNDDISLHVLFQHFQLVRTKLQPHSAIAFLTFTHPKCYFVPDRHCPITAESSPIPCYAPAMPRTN